METFAGLPLHPLAVHFVVVVVPVAALVGIAVTLWPRARTYLGWFPPLLALIALISVPIASTAGEALEHSLAPSSAIEHHASYGDAVILAVGPLFGALAMQWLLGLPRVAAMGDDPRLRGLRWFAALAVIAAAIASIVMVVLAGDSGARAVWAP